MRSIILLFVGLIFVSCSRESKIIDLRYYPEKEGFVFYPEKSIDFITLSKALDSIDCENGIRPYLNLSLKTNEFLPAETLEDKLIIQSGNGCPLGVFCKINPSMILTNDVEKMRYDWRDENFINEVEEYIFNPNDRADLAPKPSKAYFRFNLKPETSLEETVAIIKKVALTFQKVQTNQPEAKLVFVPILKFWIPPPPPNPNSIF